MHLLCILIALVSLVVADKPEVKQFATQTQAQLLESSDTRQKSILTNCENDDSCYNYTSKFEQSCSKLNGVRDGPRCFFRIETKFNWNYAWQKCESHGGLLAQIHTSTELAAAVNIMRRVTGALDIGNTNLYTTIALRRPWGDLLSEAIVPYRTMWFDNSTSYNSQLTAQNTYMRYFQTQLSYRMMYQCHILLAQNQIIAVPCSYDYYPLCMLTNKAQMFYLVDNICLTEAPIEVLYDVTAEKCANECAKLSWCRSFNHYERNTCKLFTWSWMDVESTKVIYNVKSCAHYSYDSGS